MRLRRGVIFIRACLAAALALSILFLALAVIEAEARCQSPDCWQRVRTARLERMVEKRIARITPYRCWGHRSVKPCFYIAQESATSGFWYAWNPTSCGFGFHARGIYQLCGHGEPWPVMVKRRYERLKRQLAHHRIARRLGPSHWGF